MTLISHAQNCEDVILNRSFQNTAVGFYIDVGAEHPKICSVTRAFYDRGWHGINIEPTLSGARRFKKHRPRDVNLSLIAGDHSGHETFHEVVGTGLSTINEEYARRAAKDGFILLPPRQVTCTTLDIICDEHKVTIVDFLKIDVEGAEGKVLRGFSFDRVRPIVLVIEATEPNSMKPSHAEWEPYVLAHGYNYAYKDGLNRWYVADEHHEALKQHFEYPPNVFDNYVHAVSLGEIAGQMLARTPAIYRAAKRTVDRVVRARERFAATLPSHARP